MGRVAAGVELAAAAEYRGIEAEGGGVKFGSVCSGIEAASVSWHPLGWQAAWFAEIEPFPCAVLAHHYPAVPNLGDMTTIAKRVMTGEVEAPDVLAGGTPCQAFSVAGLRESLADERGNLTLKFVELADAIDFVRVRDGRPPAIVFWENVPGVLSTKDNAFGCFLAGLAGEDEPLRAPGASGRTLVLCMDPRGQSLGGPWTPNISDWPNDAAVCSLSQVLETGSIPQRYFLSGKACAGILRRAEARGKDLPPALKSALQSVSSQASQASDSESRTQPSMQTMEAADTTA